MNDKPEENDEAVAWMWMPTGEVTTDPDKADGMWEPLFLAPPQRKPLTDEEIIECDKIAGLNHTRHHRSIKGQQMSPADDFWWHFARAIEAAHGIKEKKI